MLPWNVEDLVLDEDHFSGVVRLFPLPDFILYPHVMQPLHIFEQRYRDLLNDALDSDGLIAPAVLAPSSAADAHGHPSVHSAACLGKVVAHHRLEDGRYNVMLLGARRIRIIEELPSAQSFRWAAAEVLHDDYPSSGDGQRDALQAKLSRSFRDSLPSELLPDESTCHLLATELPLGVLTDLAAFATPLDAELKLRLLKECNVDRRAHMLIAALQVEPDDLPSPDPGSSYFPVRFSEN